MIGTAIYDSAFVWGADALHANGDRAGARPSHVKWIGMTSNLGPYKEKQPVWFTDSYLHQTHLAQGGGKRVGWILEPFDLHPENYATAQDALDRDRLDVLITSDPDRFDTDKDVRLYAHGGTRIHSSDWLVWHKSKMVSIVASPKRSLPGHAMRHAAIVRLNDKIDAYGSDYEPSTSKLDALAPYRFSVAIENVRRPFWFTEALIDCFLTGTVPIYWGTDRLVKWGFDPRGVIECDSLNDVVQAVEHLAVSDYNYRLPFIERNLLAALKYTCTEDWMWRQWPELFVSQERDALYEKVMAEVSRT